MFVSVLIGLGVLFLAISLVAYAMDSEDAKEQWMSKEKITERRKHAETMASIWNLPKPPALCCPKCGSSLSWYYQYATQDGHNIESGRAIYTVRVKYTCPKGHFPGPAGNGMVIQTGDDNSHWRWAL